MTLDLTVGSMIYKEASAPALTVERLTVQRVASALATTWAIPQYDFSILLQESTVYSPLVGSF